MNKIRLYLKTETNASPLSGYNRFSEKKKNFPPKWPYNHYIILSSKIKAKKSFTNNILFIKFFGLRVENAKLSLGWNLIFFQPLTLIKFISSLE